MVSLLLMSLSLQAGIQTDQIQSLITDGKLRQALSLTDKQLQEDEGNVTFRFLKGLILTRLNKLDEARELFMELTVEHPDLPEPYNNLAVIYASQGDFEKARDALQQAINTHPSYATAHENMGDIYAKMASKAYNQALQLDSDNSSAKAKLSLINDLFFVPKRNKEVVEAIAQTNTQTVVKSQATPGPVPAKVELAKTPATTEAGRDTVAEQIKANKAIEDGKREKEKLKSVIASTIDDWASAWSAKDAKKYIGFYGKDFTPPKKLSRTAWESQRKRRLARPRFINIRISKLKITMLGDDHARADFRQGYQSDSYQDEVSKSLILKKVADRWLITQEQSK